MHQIRGVQGIFTGHFVLARQLHWRALILYAAQCTFCHNRKYLQKVSLLEIIDTIKF